MPPAGPSGSSMFTYPSCTPTTGSVTGLSKSRVEGAYRRSVTVHPAANRRRDFAGSSWGRVRSSVLAPGRFEVLLMGDQARATAADALVFFGATGDLARKMIFPAL